VTEEAVSMRLRWFLTVAVCLLAAGVASAQPGAKAQTSPGDPRVTLPPGAPAPTNSIKEPAYQQGYDFGRRVTLDNLSRLLSQPEKSDRAHLLSFGQQKEFKRASIEPAFSRNRGFLSLQPGDKVNRLAESVNGRSSAMPPTRSSAPAPRYAPNDRQGTINP
jgi:hypothetical protein